MDNKIDQHPDDSLSPLASQDNTAFVESEFEQEIVGGIFDPADPAEPARRSRNTIRWVVIAGVVGLLVVACAAGLGYVAYTQVIDQLGPTELAELTGPLFAGPAVNNQIAFIGNDDNVWIVEPDGQNQHRITTDGRGYRFPTWAPDSRRLAFIGPTSDDKPALYISSAAEGNPNILFEDATAAPFYLYWAPDSQSITFLTQESSTLSMRQASVNSLENQRVVEVGAPFYWVWSPNSQKVLMHVGGSRASSEEAHISIIDNTKDSKRIELKLAPGGFQAPIWSSDGSHLFYIAADDGQSSIFKADAETLAQSLVTDVSGFAYMVLSPDDQNIAYLQIERGDRPPFGTAYIVGADGQEGNKLTERPVGSMYWSPDGTKLALLTLARIDDGSTAKAGGLASPLVQTISLRWWIYDVTNKELKPLISFDPTPDFLQTVPYFDQYHLSLTFWSPDSRYFVITRENPENITGGTVWVVDTTDEEEPRQVGDGTLAVWSWQ